MKKFAHILNWAGQEKQVQLRRSENDWIDLTPLQVLWWLQSEGIKPEEFRLKPATIKIGDMEVPEPIKTAPKIGTVYYSPEPNAPSLFFCLEWTASHRDLARLRRNQCHLEKDGALAHAIAQIKAQGGTP